MRAFVFLLCLQLVPAAGCGDRRPVYGESLQLLGPFGYPTGLAYIDRALGRLIRIRLTGAGPRVDAVALHHPAPRLVVPVAAGTRLAVLHDDPADPGLTVIDREQRRAAAADFLPLADGFDALAVSPAGRYGLAYFGDAQREHTGIRNLDQVQVIDFVEHRVQPARWLQTGGLNPRGIDFVPAGSGAFAGLAAVRVDNGLVFVDPADPDSELLWVRFTNAPGGVAVPAEVVFGPFHGDGGYCYVRLFGSDDVLSIRLTRDAAGRLQRSINFLNTPAGSAPSDLLVLESAGLHDKVFVVYAAADGAGAALLDANSIQTGEQTFALPVPVERAQRLIGHGPEGRREFVLVHPLQMAGDQPRVFLIDPAAGWCESVFLQDAFERVVVAPGGESALIYHPRLGSGGEPGMRLVRAVRPEGAGGWTHRLSTFGLQTLPGHERFSDDGRGLVGTLRADNNTFLLDLDSGWYDSLILDRPPSRLGLVPGSDWIWFAHPHPLGSLTLVAMDDFRREAAVMIEGFALIGLLDPGRGGG